MAGLTDQGLTILRLPEVITALKAEAIPIFQDLLTDPNDTVDTSDSSTIGRLIGLISPSLSDLWEATQEVYSAFDPNSATGTSLDNLVALSGIFRLPESNTIADVYLTGDINTNITTSLSVKSPTTGINYNIASDVLLTADQCLGVGIALNSVDVNNTYTINYRVDSQSPYISVSIAPSSNPTIDDIYTQIETEIATNHQSLITYRDNGRLFIRSAIDLMKFDFTSSSNIGIQKVIKQGVVVASVPGSIEQPANTITTIVVPALGWDSVTNPIAAVPGRGRERDEELRIRFRNTKFERSTNILESLYSALLSLSGVNNVIIYENDTDVVDIHGLPPHSFMVLIDGALPTDIGLAIWRNRPTGITSVGNTSVDIIDKYGFVRQINFSRPVEVPVFIEVKLTTNSNFPADGQEQIRTALMQYINTLNIDDDVVYSRLYTPINSVPGHQVDSLRIGVTAGDLNVSNIITNFDEIAKTSSEKIVFI